MARLARTPLLAAAAGAAAAVLGAGLGELTAAVVAPASSPFAAIGGALIDAAPTWAKDLAIAWFGTADKIALLIGIGVVLVAVAIGAGVLEWRRAPWGSVVLGAVGVAGAVVAVTRTDAGTLSWAPAAVAGVTAAIAVRLLVRMLPGPASAHAESARPESKRPESASAKAIAAEPEPLPGASRRAFLAWSGGAAVVGVLAAIGGSAMRAGSAAVTVVRDALRLPAAAVPAPAVPASAELGLSGLAPVITPNADFYRIDTALVIPQIDPADWRLRIHGMVEQEVVLRWDELLELPLVESATTLCCVSNEVGGGLIGNAMWLGYPVRDLLARARPLADADMVLSRSIDGFSASSPIEVLTDDRNSLLAIGMNGEPLPARHGFPARLVVPGLYGYVSATKWVTELEVTRFDRANAYWTDRGWSERGPIKLQSRIDVPRRGRTIDAGDTVIAGVAWQQHTGIAGVEVQIDEGAWTPADLATAISDDTWVQWSLPWTAASGEHRVRCRAISATGEVQTGDRQGVIPDGATGWHEVRVTVA